MAATDKYRAMLLFGMPGSGKGTQGAILGQIPGLVHISTGDLFRKLPKYGELGREVVKATSQGMLVPDDLTVRIWERHMKVLELQELFMADHHILLLDGMPRNYAQAERLGAKIDVVQIFHLVLRDIPAAVDRLAARALRENRLDDMNEEVIRRRFKVYQEETASTLEYYDRSLVYDIDASQSPVDVLRDIVVRLSEIQQELKAPGLAVGGDVG